MNEHVRFWQIAGAHYAESSQRLLSALLPPPRRRSARARGDGTAARDYIAVSEVKEAPAARSGERSSRGLRPKIPLTRDIATLDSGHATLRSGRFNLRLRSMSHAKRRDLGVGGGSARWFCDDRCGQKAREKAQALCGATRGPARACTSRRQRVVCARRQQVAVRFQHLVGPDAAREPIDLLQCEGEGRQRPARQRFENWKLRRALARPYFLRSTTRLSRVRKPPFFSTGLQLRLVVGERLGDAVTHRAGLARQSAAGHGGR